MEDVAQINSTASKRCFFNPNQGLAFSAIADGQVELNTPGLRTLRRVNLVTCRLLEIRLNQQYVGRDPLQMVLVWFNTKFEGDMIYDTI